MKDMRLFLNRGKPQICISFSLCVLIILSGGRLQAFARTVQEDWQIQVGDSQTYVYNEFYDVSSNNPYEYAHQILDEDYNAVTIILKRGLTLRYDITFLSTDEARGTITYNGSITSLEKTLSYRTYSGWGGSIIRPSINNKSHWVEYCRFQALENVTDDLVVTEINTDNYYFIYKWNWKTGWLDYYYENYWNISVREIFLVPQEPLPLNVIAGVFILAAIVLMLLGIKKFTH